MFLGWHKSATVALFQRYYRALYAGVPGTWREYKLTKPIGVTNPVDFSYLSEAYMSGTSAERILLGRIADAEFLVRALGGFLRAARTGPLKMISFSRLDVPCNARTC